MAEKEDGGIELVLGLLFLPCRRTTYSLRRRETRVDTGRGDEVCVDSFQGLGARDHERIVLLVVGPDPTMRR